jgi:serine/threonine protein kinase
MEPDHIGRYEIKSELGRGGMATVFRAYDPRFKRDVAIKVLPSQFLHDPTFRARFEREAQVIAAIEHPNIVPVYDYGEENEQPYLVMRFMHGGSLADLLQQKGKLSFTEASRIINQLAPALDEMHSQGIIHRDLKPGNILFDHYGNAFLSDFGIARLTQATTTLTGDAIVGTPSYMSPEQARGEEIDGRSDIYALGAILFEMLTGKTPYQATTPMGIAMKHITEPVPRILEFRSDLPQQTEEVITRAMAKSRQERFQRAVDMAAASEAVLRDQQGSVNASVAQPVKTSAPPPPQSDYVDPPVQKDRPVQPISQNPPAVSRPPSGGSKPASGGYQKTSTPPPARPVTPPPGSQVKGADVFTTAPSVKPKQASRLPVWLLVGGGLIGIVLLCALAGVLGIGPRLLKGLSLQTTATLENSPVVTSEITETVTVSQTEVTEAGKNMGDNSTEPAKRQVDSFTDDFSDPNSGWDRGQDQGSITDYSAGSYRIYVNKPNMFYWANPGLDFSDVTMEVDASKVGGPDNNFFGLICRYRDPYNFYMLAISSDGYYSIRKYENGEFSYLGPDHWVFSTGIHQGKTTNQIRGDCIGDTLTLFANGTKLAEVTDKTFTAGDLGLTAASLKLAGTDILFDNFSARVP